MQQTIIETTAGPVRGGGGARTRHWLGIPYAADTGGERRWLPPATPAPWREPRDATRFGAAAIQHISQMGLQIPGGYENGSEDCLSLNVFAPAQPASDALPVLVWIHGGGFAVGSASQPLYDGTTLAASGDVIVVTLNYRLGVLGFLRLVDVTDGRIPATGNEGLLDQVAALTWVRDNIARFGGDPQRVCVFGESAGAMSVASLATMPRAANLFQRAIMQSGSAHAAHDVAHANRVGEIFLRELPAPFRDDPRRADRSALMQAAARLHSRLMFDERLTIMPTRPVVDDTVLPELPALAMRRGDTATVPTIIGVNRDEWRYFAQVDKAMRQLDHEALLQRLRYHFDDDAIADLLDAYHYVRDEPQAQFRVYASIMGDAAFRVSSQRAAHDLAARQPVFRYRFDYPIPAMRGLLGACHVAEIPFVFGNFDGPGKDVWFRDDAPSRALSAEVRLHWRQFAADGDPGVDDWPPLSAARGELRYATTTRYVSDVDNDIEAFWADVDDGFLRSV